MRRKATIIIALFAVLFAADLASAATFLVYEFDSAGVDETTAKLVSSLVRAELAAQPKTRVIPGEGKCFEEACARAAREESKADAVVVGKLITLGKSTSLSVQAVWKKETLNYRVLMEDIGEINVLAPRLATAIAEKRTFVDAATVTTISEREKTMYKRVEGDFSWGPALGVLVPVNNSYGGADILYSIDLLFRYEIEHLGFEFDTGIYFSDGSDEKAQAYEWPLDFAMMYYFFDTDHSPFVGGSVGLHSIGVTLPKEEIEEEDDEDKEDYFHSWTASVSGFVGYELLRTHTLHVSFRAGYRYGFAALDGPGAHGPFLNIAMTF